MYKPTFQSKDDEEQFYAKVNLIEIEKQKEIDRNISIAMFNEKVKNYQHPDSKKDMVVADDDYQRDVDHDLSMGAVTE